MSSFSVLAVDDDPVQLELIAAAARKLEYPPIDVVCAETVAAALSALEHAPPEMVICDYRLPDGSGLDVLADVRRRNPLVPVIIITAHESVNDAVELMKRGARDYLVKPLRSVDIQQTIVTNLQWRHEETDYAALAEEDLDQTGIVESVSEPMKRALRTAARAARSEVSILIQGESGTGKELIAHLVHRKSDRADGPFVPVHIAALPETLIESELFGHKRGAFTGAQTDHPGLFEQANGGTLFIDEIGEIPLSVQVKLLRAIQFREIQRIGDEAPRKLDVRIVAATNRDLEAMTKDGTFREDLFYRVHVVTVELPPLRERRQDIPQLVEMKIRELAARNGRSMGGITQRALNLLVRYTFPGNVRELENILERAVVLARQDRITEDDLPAFILAGDEAEPVCGSLDEQLQSLERRLILNALQETHGNQSRAASLLEITERRLRSRMERLDIKNPF